MYYAMSNYILVRLLNTDLAPTIIFCTMFGHSLVKRTVTRTFVSRQFVEKVQKVQGMLFWTVNEIPVGSEKGSQKVK